MLSGPRTARFTEGGKLLGVSGRALPFDRRSGIAVDGSGNVFGIAGNSGPGPLVLTFDRTGNRVAVWGAPGSDPGRLADPSGLAVDRGGRVYVASRDWPGVVVFDATGALLEQWDVWPDAARGTRSPSALTVDARGNVYVVGHDQPRSLRLGLVGEGRQVTS